MRTTNDESRHEGILKSCPKNMFLEKKNSDTHTQKLYNKDGEKSLFKNLGTNIYIYIGKSMCVYNIVRSYFSNLFKNNNYFIYQVDHTHSTHHIY